MVFIEKNFMKKGILYFGVILFYAAYVVFYKASQGTVSPMMASQNNTLPTSSPSVVPPPASAMGGRAPMMDAPMMEKYRDGQYTGDSVYAYYGYVQVKAIVAGGKVTDVQFLRYPDERSTSRMINAQATRYLTQEAIQKQDGTVDAVSGATFTSEAFIQSLTSALAQAKN